MSPGSGSLQHFPSNNRGYQQAPWVFLVLSLFFQLPHRGPWLKCVDICTHCLLCCKPPCFHALLGPPESDTQLGEGGGGAGKRPNLHLQDTPLRAGPARKQRHEIPLCFLASCAESPLCLFPSYVNSHVAAITTYNLHLTNSNSLLKTR